jgi:hypothetical protein
VGSLGCLGYLCAGRLCVVHSYDGAEEEGPEGSEAEEGAVGWVWIVGPVVGVLWTQPCVARAISDAHVVWVFEDACLNAATTTWPRSAFRRALGSILRLDGSCPKAIHLEPNYKTGQLYFGSR